MRAFLGEVFIGGVSREPLRRVTDGTTAGGSCRPEHMGYGSVPGERSARLGADLDAALERLVIRDRFAARESLAHGLDDHAFLGHTGFLELECHHLRALLRQ